MGKPSDSLVGELQNAVMKGRMQPVGRVFQKYNRLARDVARQLGKEAELEIEGESTEVDKTILDALNDPLVHLVRNAVDHGIENPQDRVAAGKNPEGVLTLRAYHEAGQVHLEITEDGAGIDPQKIVVSGDSAGGHLALTTGFLPASAGLDRQCPGSEDLHVAAVVNWYGISDVNELLDGPNDFR